MKEGVDVGLKLWLLFLAAFGLLGYPAELCIILGAIGGLAGGFIAAWKQAAEPSKKAEEETPVRSNSLFSRARNRIALLSSEPGKEPVQDPSKAMSRLYEKVFRRRRPRSLRSRR